VDDSSQPFGALLRRRRLDAGLTQEELANRTGLSVRAISDIERDITQRPHSNSVLMLARALGLDESVWVQLAKAGRRRDDGPVPPLDGLVPRQLPHALAHFVGREAEMSTLTGLLDRPGDPSGAVVISAIGGTAGVGKTALAVQWAHRVSASFPDGQLYMNLRGFDPSMSQMDPAEVIRAFLDALGVPADGLPAQADAQAGLYRSLLADKRMLIVLDNARHEGQVRPLLPASPASLVIVTSRNQLSGLAAADGARLLSLDLLTRDESVRLLTSRIGARRAAAEPGAVDEIAASCAFLPLALAVAAARAAARPRFSLTELAVELRGAADRLDVLDADDPAVSVGAVFSWSYQQVSPGAARLFRLLGLHPGPDISVPAAGSLAGIDRAEAGRLLRELVRDCLISEHAPGRYASHDLLRAYAVRRARDCDSEPERGAAIGRLLDHYLHSACRAALLLRPSQTIELAPPRPGAVPEQPGDHRQAVAWFDAEHQVLLAVVALATETGADSHAWQIPWAMVAYFRSRGLLHDRVPLLSGALAAATRLDDAFGQAESLRGLGAAFAKIGEYEQARAHLERCLTLFRRLGDQMGEAFAQQNLSSLAEAQGRYSDAIDHGEEALRLFQATGHAVAAAALLGDIAWFHALLGNYQQARAFCEESLAHSAKLDDCDFEYNVWDTLGYIDHHLGDFAGAAAHFDVALDLCRDNGDRCTEAVILIHAGDARRAAGELPLARQAWQQALAIYDDIDHPDAEKVRAKLASDGGLTDSRADDGACHRQFLPAAKRRWNFLDEPGQRSLSSST
jgi:tetratricopeptide (TPR) repeat protein/transcriptional regulator with XRE-family HTH domain